MDTLITGAKIVGVGTAVVGGGLMLAGFGAGGIVAGSVAAGIQSGIGNVAAGSVFATVQSLGMTGVLSTTTTLGGVFGVGGILHDIFIK